jgi:hypothetical protein
MNTSPLDRGHRSEMASTMTMGPSPTFHGTDQSLPPLHQVNTLFIIWGLVIMTFSNIPSGGIRLFQSSIHTLHEKDMPQMLCRGGWLNGVLLRFQYTEGFLKVLPALCLIPQVCLLYHHRASIIAGRLQQHVQSPICL